MPELTLSVAELSPGRPVFDSRPVRNGYMVDTMALEKVSSEYFVFTPSDFLSALHTHILFIYY